MLNRSKTTDLVSSQFPEFYNWEGANFVAFVEAYYKWMETNGYGRSATDLPSIRDIDDTESEFLTHFRETYMNGIPPSLLGNQRLLQKHILDLYRSKGSYESVKLLFRLLYNEDVEMYIPSYDILKTSDGRWVQRRYIEITNSPYNLSLENEMIRGSKSNATAFVETYERRTQDNQVIHVLYISNIKGQFVINETLFKDASELEHSPKIKGSSGAFEVVSSTPNFVLGESLYDTTNTEITYKVSKIKSSSDGILIPFVAQGGRGYSLRGFTVTQTIQDPDNLGTGFDFIISEISDTETILTVTNQISDFAAVPLNSANFGMPGPGPDDLSSVIGDALDYENLEVGTVSGMIVTNPGTNYSDLVTVKIRDNLVAPLYIPDTVNGGFYGNNAVIEGRVSIGTNMVEEVAIENSAFNAVPGRHRLNSKADANRFVLGDMSISTFGNEAGFFKTTHGFLSSDKYLQDSDYYQEYSYDIQTSRSISSYFDILKKISHPTGNKVFGSTNVRQSEVISVTGTTTVIFDEVL
jgi:hypothetical protein